MSAETSDRADVVPPDEGAHHAGAGPNGAVPAPATAGRAPRRRPSTRFLRSELRLVLGRRRNHVVLLVLAAVPVLLGVVVRVADGPASGEGPPFLASVTQNGLFLAFVGLVTTLPLFLPLAVGVAAGDSVAGEASTGTLRYLLTVPVGRTRLLAVKLAGVVAYATAGALVVAVAGLLTGLALFPAGDVVLISGVSVPYGEALLRALAVTLYVAVSLTGLAAVGLLVSTLTEVPVAVVATTVVVAIVSQILDSVPQLDWLHPYLLSHQWFAFGDLLRTPVVWDTVLAGVVLQLGWLVGAGALAWWRFSGRDVTS